MRREGYEFAISKPQVITKMINNQLQEPYELLVIEVNEEHQGAVMELIGSRKGDLTTIEPGQKGRIRLEYIIPTRGLIGFQTTFMMITSGTGVAHHVFEHFGPFKTGIMVKRQCGVLLSNTNGVAKAYTLFNLQERGSLLIHPQTEVYEGMIIGINSRRDDMAVNPTKGKHLTNIRAAGSDENIILVPPVQMQLERAMEFIEDDELIEITPKSMRLRKKVLSASDRRRDSRISDKNL
jgi:GTP-binding protein